MLRHCSSGMQRRRHGTVQVSGRGRGANQDAAALLQVGERRFRGRRCSSVRGNGGAAPVRECRAAAQIHSGEVGWPDFGGSGRRRRGIEGKNSSDYLVSESSDASARIGPHVVLELP